MKNIILLLAGMLCLLAAPPGASASVPMHPTPVVYEFKATAAPVLPSVYLCVAPASAVQAVAVAPVASTETAAAVSVESAGAAVHHYLSQSGAQLRIRPGWRGLVGSGYTRHQTPELRGK